MVRLKLFYWDIILVENVIIKYGNIIAALHPNFLLAKARCNVVWLDLIRDLSIPASLSLSKGSQDENSSDEWIEGMVTVPKIRSRNLKNIGKVI